MRTLHFLLQTVMLVAFGCNMHSVTDRPPSSQRNSRDSSLSFDEKADKAGKLPADNPSSSADDTLTKAEKFARSADDLVENAAIEGDSSGYEEALGLYSKAIELEEREPKYRLARIQLLSLTGTLDDAMDEINYALRNNLLSKADLQAEMGCIYLKKGQFQDAVNKFSLAIEELDSDSLLQTRRGKVHFFELRGDAYTRLGDHKNAFEDYSKFPKILFEKRFSAAVLSGEYKVALEIATNASKSRPPRGEYFAWLAMVLAASPDPDVQNPKMALDAAEQAIALSEANDPVAEMAMAAACAANGDFESAVLHQEKAITSVKKEVSTEMREQMEAYRSKRSYRFGGTTSRAF